MKSYIKDILLLNDNEKRCVSLKQGVNIITGDSKTGKSALVEIIDYCLCSSRATIPKGIITDFTKIYCISLIIDDSCYVIGRQSTAMGSKMYISIEAEGFDTKLLDISYFDDKVFRNHNEIKNQIENALGLSVSNMQTDELDEKPNKASLRNMVSYLFQHQNLMASKFALFYRFSDFYKRKAIIQQFPVFAGLVDQEYYSKLIRLNELKAKLKKLNKDKNINAKAQDKAKSALAPKLENYFSLLNLEFDTSMTLCKMISTSKNLPVFDDSVLFDSSGIWERYKSLEIKLDHLRDQEQELNSQINNIERASNAGNSFLETLVELKEKTEISMPKVESEYVCPLCNNVCNHINKNDNEIFSSSSWLDDELSITTKYTSDFSEDIRKLSGELDKIVSEIKKVWKEINEIKNRYMYSTELQSQKDKIEYAKTQIIIYVEMFQEGIFKDVDKDIDSITAEIKILENQIDGFDLDTAMYKAQVYISENMNKLAQKLDFEEEYEPINLNFELVNQTFDIYHHQNGKEKIFLYEMGSGANWVSTHIALFLSFMRYFCTNPYSPMLTTMFFDQPSQVYFPAPTDIKNAESTDLLAVKNMYQTIFDEINSIGKDTGNLPQIIIVDHVKGDELANKTEFKSYVRCNWRNGKHLI